MAVEGAAAHLLWGMVRAKTKVAALQPTVCAAWLQAWMSIRYSVKWCRLLNTARSRGTLSSWIWKSELFSPSRRAPAARRCLPESLERLRVRAVPPPSHTPQLGLRPRSPLRALIDGRHLPRGSGETRESPVMPAWTRPSAAARHLQTHPQPGPAHNPPSPQDTPPLAPPAPPAQSRPSRTWGW